MPKVFRVVVPAADLDRSATFYAQVLQTPGERISPSRHYFHLGDVILVRVAPRNEGKTGEVRPNSQPIDFAVDDLDAAFARAKAAECSWLEEKIETRPWGERSFVAKDPFGNPLYFVDAATCFTGFHPPAAHDVA